ncbi:MAG: hypothetical protein E7158_03365 [Firmicutes bacterium]|nr:hypothetical protein [Bacillota bacterium]
MKKISQSDIIKISIFVVPILLFTVLALLFSKNENNNADNIEKDEIYNKYKEVDDYHTYFFISKNINNFITEKNASIVIELLSSDYIKKNNITENNVFDFLEFNNEEYEYKIKELRSYEQTQGIIIYYMSGNISDTYSNNIIQEEVKFLVGVDYDNLIYTVKPIKKLEKDMTKINITKNNYNTYEGVNMVNTQDICRIYLADYVMMSSSEKIKITNNVKKESEIEKYQFSSVMKNCYYGNNTSTFIIIDENNNKYEFQEKSIMNYTVVIN